ncbi:TPA: hypothetical protein ACR8SX_005501, partial [Klebsiella quasipneumoniae]
KKDFLAGIEVLDRLCLNIEKYKTRKEYKKFIESLKEAETLLFFNLIDFLEIEDKRFCFDAYYENKDLYIGKYNKYNTALKKKK